MQERRAAQRFACDANVELEGPGGDRLSGRAIDISMGGIGVQLGAAVLEMLSLTPLGGVLEPGTPEVRVRIHFREDGPADVLTLRGVPRHVRRLSREHYRLGAQLAFENPAQRQALQAWVDRLQGSDAAGRGS
jgi:hypothetical protein